MPSKSLRNLARAVLEAYHHLRLTSGKTLHIHVVRESNKHINWTFFHWLKREHPQIFRLFRHTSAFSLHSTVSGNTALFIPWLQDPVRERNHALFLQIKELEKQYERIGVPIINPVEVLSNSIKSRALEAIRITGVRTAHVVQIDKASTFETIVADVGLPFIVRNDQGHGGYVRLVQNPEDFQVLEWERLPHPIALEFIDTRSEDGLFRKYRYLLTGDTGISRHLVISKSWCVHAKERVRNEQYIEEELKFLNSENPYHDKLNKARQALGMDYVAFDYSIDEYGNLIIWEPNPFPSLWASFNARDSYFTYQKEYINKVYSHILRYYLERASIPMTARFAS